MTLRERFPIPWILFAAAIIALPLVTSSSYVIGVMCFIALYGAVAVGMGVLLEQAGIFSLAQPTWFGLELTWLRLCRQRIAPPWVGVIIGALVVALSHTP